MTLRKATDRGFSLVELMIVVALVALLGGVAGPALYGYIPRYRVEGAAKALASEMSLAKMKAIAGNVRHQVAFDEGAQTITVNSVDETGTVISTISTITLRDSGTNYPDTRLGRNPTLPLPNSSNGSTTGGAAFGAGAATDIIFLPSGIANMGGEFFLIPNADYKPAGDLVNIRAVQVSLTGMVRKFRVELINPSGARNQASNTRWVEY